MTLKITHTKAPQRKLLTMKEIPAGSVFHSTSVATSDTVLYRTTTGFVNLTRCEHHLAEGFEQFGAVYKIIEAELLVNN